MRSSVLGGGTPGWGRPYLSGWGRGGPRWPGFWRVGWTICCGSRARTSKSVWTLCCRFSRVGSTIASGGGLIILAEAVRSGVSVPVLLRMGGNMLLNTLLDYLPLAGPVVSAFFKSNVRNLQLLQKGRPATRKPSGAAPSACFWPSGASCCCSAWCCSGCS